MSKQNTIGITLFGAGVVGGGVLRILGEQSELLYRRSGLRFDVRHVVVRNPSKYNRALPLTTDGNMAVDDPNVQILVELAGGTSTASDIIERALRLGKTVITANKALLALRSAELFSLARKNNASIGFEASCCGGIPIIGAIQRGLVANRINALVGIVNGTCNFILTRMTRNGWSYDQSLKEAQKLGFAEADPTLDVSGRDAAQKLAILASLAFDARVAEKDVHVEGIDTLEAIDIQFAKGLGYVIKLLAIAERSNDDDKLTLRVHPSLVHEDDVLADVNDSFNAVSVYGHALGHAVFYGRGAGAMPTASAVVSDLVSAAMGIESQRFQHLRALPDLTEPVKTLPLDQLTSRYYLRLMVYDEPGVIAKVSSVLGKYGISLSSIHQKESDPETVEIVPLVITTHEAKEGAIRDAIKEIDSLNVVKPVSKCLRIIDSPKE
jgi:homoserine dehydrogenase